MKRKNDIMIVLMMLSAVFLFWNKSEAQKSFDSLKIKMPKHYFQTVILLDGYQKPNQNIKDTSENISNRLKTYGVQQFIFSLSTPVATIERISSDSVIKNTHILFTLNYLKLQPQFEGLSKQHDLVKSGIGVRLIHNTGKKGIWFFDVSPFVTRDATYKSRSQIRMASTFVYSHSTSEKLNWRVGLTKSFLWGNRLYLPFIGLRVGRLDKTHFSIQFPRNMSLNVPLNNHFRLSVYTKPQGGVFNFSNSDSLYRIDHEATFHFARYEINSGLRLDFKIANWFSAYIATGFSTKNNITFYPDKANQNTRLNYYKFFYSSNLQPTAFYNFGLVFKWGKTKSYYNNKNIYEVIDLNNTMGNGTDNISTGNTQIPITPKKKASDMHLQSVQDLIDYNDF